MKIKTSQLRQIVQEAVRQHLIAEGFGDLFRSSQKAPGAPPAAMGGKNRQAELVGKLKAGALNPEEQKELMALLTKPVGAAPDVSKVKTAGGGSYFREGKGKKK